MRIVRPKSKAWFSDFTDAYSFEESGCVWCEPMLAQEISEAEQEKYFHSKEVYVEEKFDGTRGILQFFDNKNVGIPTVPQRGFTRCFSRRVSKKTKWFCENTDSLPHLRGIDAPELAGTILDGEMFIDGRPFKDVSSTLNCLSDEAIRRQEELGNITFHAFDIVRYKDTDCEGMPLEKRKAYLKKVIDKVNHPNLVMVPFYDSDNIEIRLYVRDYEKLASNKENYPELWKQVTDRMELTPSMYPEKAKDSMWAKYYVSKRGYYEYIILTGGEGVILKPKDGRYFHKRGKEYMKVKKFLTREVIITGYISPTREYAGAFPKDRWAYWLDDCDNKYPVDKAQAESARNLRRKGYTPITKFYYLNQVGTVEYGVILEDSDTEKNIPKLKSLDVKTITLNGKSTRLLVVGECSGITDEEREYISAHSNELLGSVIEVKANELFKDTGKMRHPRFLRFRTDKNIEECTWSNHVR